jgi:hypothetical protein
MSDAIQPEEKPPSRLPLVRLAKGQEVSLGCGTMILIGIIVGMSIGSTKTGIDRVENQVRELTQKLEQVEQKLDDLAKKLPPGKR